jgi:hypothetical protein
MLLRKWKAFSPPRFASIRFTLELMRELTQLFPAYLADDGIRTRDLLITNQLLYQLSYVGDSLENSR